MKCTGIAPAVPPTAASAATTNAASRRNSRRPTNVQPPQSADECFSVIESGIEEYDAGKRRAEPERDAGDGTELEMLPGAVAGGGVGVELLVRALDQIAIDRSEEHTSELRPV